MNRWMQIAMIVGAIWPARCGADEADSFSLLCSWIDRYTREQMLLNAYSTGRMTLDVGEASFQFIYIPPGDYVIGMNDEERRVLVRETSSALLGWNCCERRQIRLAEGFFLLDREVTHGQFASLCPLDPPDQGVGVIISDDLPHTSCSWEKCITFCELLSTESRCCVRLPTEIEWEVAARGPEGRLFSEKPALHMQLSNETSAVLNTSALRPLLADQPRDRGWNGVFDMTGNAREWCLDVYDAEAFDHLPEAYVPSSVTVEEYSASLPASGRVERACRGGDFRDEVPFAAAPLRRSLYQDESGDSLGFRLVLIPDSQVFDSAKENSSHD